MILFAGLIAAALIATDKAVADPLPSGTSFLSDNLKNQQADEAANPGMLWVGAGEELWKQKAGTADKSCATCHENAENTMRGVATRYPKIDAASGKLINLEGRINLCRTENQKAEAFDYESEGLLALTAYIARQSLGVPVNVVLDPKAQPHYERGKEFFYRRQGQLNLSCAQCHEENAGKPLRGNTISYGIGNGYPAYRLEWQSLGSLHRRFKSCAFGVRAKRFQYGSPEYLDLELYLAVRAKGVVIETPAIRP